MILVKGMIVRTIPADMDKAVRRVTVNNKRRHAIRNVRPQG